MGETPGTHISPSVRPHLCSYVPSPPVVARKSRSNALFGVDFILEVGCTW